MSSIANTFKDIGGVTPTVYREIIWFLLPGILCCFIIYSGLVNNHNFEIDFTWFDKIYGWSFERQALLLAISYLVGYLLNATGKVVIRIVEIIYRNLFVNLNEILSKLKSRIVHFYKDYSVISANIDENIVSEIEYVGFNEKNNRWAYIIYERKNFAIGFNDSLLGLVVVALIIYKNNWILIGIVVLTALSLYSRLDLIRYRRELFVAYQNMKDK